MKLFVLLLCCVAPVACLAQVDSTLLDRSTRMNQSGCRQVYWVEQADNCAAATSLAERDVRANTPFLILSSGEAPVMFTTDAAFEKRFKAEYYEMGCIAPPAACALAYNCRIFDYLQATYGKTWQRQVRKDVIGLKEWKRQH